MPHQYRVDSATARIVAVFVPGGGEELFFAMTRATGDAAAAERHAAAAFELSERWRIPAFAAWFDGVWAQRARPAQR